MKVVILIALPLLLMLLPFGISALGLLRGGDALILFMVIGGVWVYFLPAIIASLRGKDGTGGVFLLNLLLGWTVIGWAAAFIWAFTGSTKISRQRDEERHHELMRALKEGKQS